MKLRIAENFSLPEDAVTETFGVLAKRGVGKSYTAMVMAEEMLKATVQIVAVDPTGAWWGLRASADGKGPGLPIIVMGGEHGDVPLEETAGKIVADFIVDHRASVVLDVGLFRKGQAIRFMTDFAENLYHRNRSPLHLFLDEADLFAPQKPMHGQERLLGAIEDVVRRGRIRGLGITMVTQRSAVLNKNILTQIETLVLLRTISPQDRDAAEEWIKIHAVEEEKQEVMSSLPSLANGTAWVWSPGWLGTLKKIDVRRRETFDSSATPGRKRIEPAKLAEVDLDALKTSMAATIERAKHDDPKELRKEIAALKLQLAARPKPEADAAAVQLAVDRAVLAERKRAVSEVAALRKDGDRLRTGLSDLVRRAANLAGIEAPAPTEIVMLQQPFVRQLPPSHASPRQPARPNGHAPERSGQKVRAGAERMLAALCQWSPNGMTMGQMRAHAGMKKSGTFSTYLGDLRREGYIEERGDEVFATQAGLDYFGEVPAAPATTDEVLAIWNPKLRDGARRMLAALVAAGGDTIGREELAGAAGMTNSGTFTTYLGDLKTAQLAVVTRDGVAANRETLFL